MNKFWLMGLLLLYIGYVSAQDICLEPIKANVTCFMVTPIISCPVYTYSMYDNQADMIASGTLSVFNDSTYYFNFTEDVGTYYIAICDGSTRQVIVEGDNMIGLTGQRWIFIILILLFAIFIWLAFRLNPLFLMLDGFILGYFAFYTYASLSNVFVLILMSLVSIIFIFVGLIGGIAVMKQ